MGMIRACSYVAEIETPEAPSEYSAIQVTVMQGDTTITKTKAQLTLTENSIMLKLDQTETKQFTCGASVFIQVRCYKSQYEAPGSEVFGVQVYPALNDEVLS